MDILYTTSSMSVVPRKDEAIIFNNDTYFINNVIWAPELDIVNVHVSNNLQGKKEDVPDMPESGLSEARSASRTADEALKETKELKRQLFSIRQRMKHNQGNNNGKT